jgi:hypothetical protein
MSLMWIQLLQTEEPAGKPRWNDVNSQKIPRHFLWLTYDDNYHHHHHIHNSNVVAVINIGITRKTLKMTLQKSKSCHLQFFHSFLNTSLHPISSDLLSHILQFSSFASSAVSFAHCPSTVSWFHLTILKVDTEIPSSSANFAREI